MNELFSYKSLVHALSGMAGGASAISTFCSLLFSSFATSPSQTHSHLIDPLNVIRTRLQVSESKEMEGMLSLASRMLQEEGPSSFFRGWQSQVTALAASNFVYFYQYNGLSAVVKNMQLRRGGSKELSTGMNLLIASVAGVINVLVTTPLWVVSTRLSVQRRSSKVASSKNYKGMWDGLTRIASEEGVMALWNGTLPSLLLVSNPSIQFVAYERVKRWFTARSESRGTPLTALEFFIMGAIAKAIATVMTYPIQLAQSRLRAMKSQDAKKPKYQYKGTLDVLLKVLQNDGPLGLYRGMEAKLYQTVATAAFMFMVYEKIQRTVFTILRG